MWTKQQALNEFNAIALPCIVASYGPDQARIREAWNDWIDYLDKSGRLPETHREWTSPFS